MKFNIRFLVGLILVLLVGCVYFIMAQVSPDRTKTTTGTMECDMKRKVKAPKCAKCQKILMGLKCIDCDKEENKCQKCKHLFLPEETENNKCPCCGSKNLVEAQLVNKDRCFFCNEPVKMIDVCVKQIYACPEHPDYQDLKAGNCPEKITDAEDNKKACEKKLVPVGTVYSEIIDYFVCPKCKMKQEEPGKCDACKQPLTREKICKDSGKFPHVNELEWNKTLEIITSQPEVKIFEGTRTPQLKSWTYLFYCPKTKEAALVDASCDADELAKYINEHKLKLKYIFISHSHNDHFVTQAQIQSKCRDAKPKVIRFNSPLKDNDYIKVGELTLKIFHTPGHASDCIVIWVGNILFAGDSFDSQPGQEETRKRLKGKGTFTIYGGHGCWKNIY